MLHYNLSKTNCEINFEQLALLEQDSYSVISGHNFKYLEDKRSIGG